MSRRYAASFIGTMLALVQAFDTQVAYAATFEPIRSPYNDPTMGIMVQGAIDADDPARLEASIAEAVARFPDHRLRAIGLNSPGGLVAAAAEMAQTIRKFGFATTVPDDAMCASACFILFAAGSIQVVSPRARVGVHGANIAGQQTTDALAVTTNTAKLYAELGVPASVIGRMVVTDPDDMTWLTAEEIRLFPRGFVQRFSSTEFPEMFSGLDGTTRAENFSPSYQHTNRALPLATTPRPYTLSAPPHTQKLIDKATQYSEGYLYGVTHGHASCSGTDDWRRGCNGGLYTASRSWYNASTSEWPLAKQIESWLDAYDEAYRSKNPIGGCGSAAMPSNDGCDAGSRAWPRSEIQTVTSPPNTSASYSTRSAKWDDGEDSLGPERIRKSWEQPTMTRQ
jgi:ATP-dependent protease ClpP protease subunit